MAEARAKTMQQEREELCVALQCAASFHCLVEAWKDCEELRPKLKEKWFFLETKSENTKHRTEWCAETNKYRCMRCGRGITHMKLPEKCTGPKGPFELRYNGELLRSDSNLRRKRGHIQKTKYDVDGEKGEGKGKECCLEPQVGREHYMCI